MRVFLTGASGWIGSEIARGLLGAGHTVVGLMRSKEKGDGLAAAGGMPVVGSLADLDVLRNAAADADGVAHTAFGLDFSKIKEMAEEERLAMEAFADVYAGFTRPIVVTGGFL